MVDPDNVESVDAQLQELRSNISDLGHQLDSYKTKTAAAFGAGVFFLLLAAGAGYDLLTHKSTSWMMLGVTRESLCMIAYGLGGCAIVLVLVGLFRIKRRDLTLSARLDRMEQEYAEMLENKKSNTQNLLDNALQ